MTLSLTPSSPSDLSVSASRRSIPSPWLSLQEAAKRSGKHAGHLRRLCAGWLSDGKAREVKGGGKRARYEVREDADPAFARVKFAEAIGTDLRHVSDRKRTVALFRRAILVKWSEAVKAAFTLGFDRDRATNHFCEQLLLGQVAPWAPKSIKVSRATLYGWQSKWDAGGLAGLVDARGGGKEKAVDPFLEEVKRLYLRRPPLSISRCYRIAEYKGAEQGWTMRTYETARRMIEKIPKGVVLKLREGEDAYVAGAEPYIERHKDDMRSNQLWCGDHHQFDVIVNSGGKLIRPWLTAWQDVRSCKFVGWSIFAHDPNTDTILSALRDACLAHGVPEGVYVDNGKDYDSYALNGRTKKDRWTRRTFKLPLDARGTGIFAALDVAVTHCWPYHGQSKPIERWFGTFEGDTPAWDTYCGNSPAKRREDLQEQLERGKAPTLEAFTDWFGALLVGYHAAPSQAMGLAGKSPDQAFAENLATKRTTTRELLDALCLRRTQPVKVGQNGVTYQGLRFGQYCPELFPLLGKEVVLAVDDRDLSAVQVWTVEGKFLCLAPSNQRVPFQASAQDLREAITAKKKHRKLIREYHEVRPRMAEDLPDLIVRAMAAKRAAETDAGGGDVPPPSIKPIRSDFESQLPAVRAAVAQAADRRIAVGGESIDLEQITQDFDLGGRPTPDVFDRFRDLEG